MFWGSVWGQMTYTSTGSGDWSTMTWSSTGTAGDNDHYVIADGHTVTINQDIIIGSLTVGQGNSGVLVFDGINRAITISGNVAIETGATFITQAETTATHLMNVGGDLLNNGIFDMSQDGTSFVCDVTFNNDGNQTISGNGITTRFNGITLNMGTSNTNILEVTAENFSAKNAFLVINNGTFKLTSVIEVNAFSGAITIPTTGGIWVNGGTINTTGGSVLLNGKLQIDLGTLNIGNSTGNKLDINGSGAELIMTGGVLTISAYWDQTNSGDANISGGIINVLNNGPVSNSIDIVYIPNNSDFIMTGGCFNIKNLNTGSGAVLDINKTSNTVTISGGEINIENSAASSGNSIIIIDDEISLNNLNITIGNGAIIENVGNNLEINNNLTINSGALQINSETSLTVSGTLTNNVGVSGLVIKSDINGTGSLINSTSGVTATIQRYLTKYDDVNDSKYHFISSPVSAQPIFTDLMDFYRFSETNNFWINRTSSGDPEAFNDVNFAIGRGYLVADDADVTKLFNTGTLNTYPVSDPLELTGTYTADKGNGWNLFGNPFPSAIDWNTVEKGSGMDNALYYYDASIQNYRYFIQLSGETTIETGEGSRYIPAMQGFMVHAKSTGTKTITIDNQDRVHEAQTTFYKSSQLNSGVLSLKVNTDEYEDIAMIHFAEGATTAFDGDYDAYKLFSYNTSVPQIYTLSVNNELLAINGLPEITEDLQIPVLFKAGQTGEQILTADVSQIEATVTLIDVVSSASHNLTNNPVYSFTSTEGDDPNRFLLHFGAVGIDEPAQLNEINAYVYNNSLYVQSQLENAQMALYDIQGRQMLTEHLNGSGLHKTELNLPTGIYIVRLQSNNQVKNIKVFIN